MALTVPNTFVAGTTAVASEVNDNFTAVKTFVDGLETDVTTLETKSPVITLAGDLTGSATLTNLGNATLTATIAANSVALGTDTTGNYVSNVTAGTGVTVTHTPGEGSSAAVAIDSAIVPQLGSANTFTTNQIISGSTATDLLRITQTGAGNALVVEDETNPDATPFVIDASGQVGIGAVQAATNLNISKSITGSVNAQAIRIASPVGSGVTGEARYMIMVPSVDASVAMTNLVGARFYGATLGAGASITTQVGFWVDLTTTTATNNYGFRGAIASGTGRYNLYMDGTADNYIAGQVGIGATPSAGRSLTVGKAITGATTAFGILNNGAIQSDVTVSAIYYRSGANTVASAFTLSSLYHFNAAQVSFGAGSTVTTQIGFAVDSGMTGATNNYGFYSDIASGTGRWNFVANGTAANYMAGRLGVGATLTSGAMALIVNTTAADAGLIVRGAASQSGNLVSIQNSAASSLVTVASSGEFALTSNATSNAPFQINAGLSGATTAFASIIQSTIASSVTSDATGYRTAMSTAAAAFTLTTLRHFTAGNVTLGSTSAVTNQIGFYTGALTNATSNFGFYGDLAAASNRWNLYMNGTAANYLAGRLGVGATLTSGAMMQVVNTTAADDAVLIKGAASQSGYLTEWQNNSATTLAYIDASGNAKFVSVDGGSA